jgi:hypothetical protein
MRLIDTHNSEGKDTHVEDTNAKQLEVIASSQSIKGKDCHVKIAKNK